MGVTVALMYYGLLRSTDVLAVKVQDVSIRTDKVEIKFNHSRKRVNHGFTFWVPYIYLPIFRKYLSELSRSDAPSNSRFLKNYNPVAKTRTVSMGKNMVSKFIKKMCELLGFANSQGYTTHCFRRSAATNLADAGVSLVNLKRHGQWKSDTVAERYIANSVPLRQERATKLLPSHLRYAKLPPSLTNQWSSSSSEGSFDPPLENLRYAGTEGSSARRLTLSPPAVAAPAVVSPAVARGTPENVTPARSAVRNLYKKPKQPAQKPPANEIIVIDSSDDEDDIVYAIDGTPIKVSPNFSKHLKSRKRGATYNNCTFFVKEDEKK